MCDMLLIAVDCSCGISFLCSAVSYPLEGVCKIYGDTSSAVVDEKVMSDFETRIANGYEGEIDFPSRGSDVADW